MQLQTVIKDLMQKGRVLHALTIGSNHLGDAGFRSFLKMGICAEDE